MSVRAAERAKELGTEQALETLRQELELVPPLGALLGPRRQDGVEVRKTWAASCLRLREGQTVWVRSSKDIWKWFVVVTGEA